MIAQDSQWFSLEISLNPVSHETLSGGENGSILAWRIPWTEELGQSLGLQRVGHNWWLSTAQHRDLGLGICFTVDWGWWGFHIDWHTLFTSCISAPPPGWGKFSQWDTLFHRQGVRRIQPKRTFQEIQILWAEAEIGKCMTNWLPNLWAWDDLRQHTQLS